MKIFLLYSLAIISQISFTIAGRKSKIKQKFTHQTLKFSKRAKIRYPKTYTPTMMPSELGRMMLKHELYPKFLHILPQKRCNVTYPSGVQADAGNILNFKDVKDTPNVTWDADPEQHYTLIFRDTDDDEGRTASSHSWLIVNIPGNCIANGSTVSKYKLPALPKSGAHHFVFLVYKQLFVFEEMHLASLIDFLKQNLSFDLNVLISTFHLIQPGFGNFFIVKYSTNNKLKYTTRNWTLEFLEGTEPLPIDYGVRPG